MLKMLAIGSILDWTFTERENLTVFSVRVMTTESYKGKDDKDVFTRNLLVCSVFKKDEKVEEFKAKLKKDTSVFIECEMPTADKGVNEKSNNIYGFWSVSNVKSFLFLDKGAENFIKIIGTGNVCADAEVRPIDDFREAINFSVAFNEKRKSANGETIEKAVFVSCGMFREKGKSTLSLYIKKGQKILIEGKPTVRTGQDKEGKPTCYFNSDVQNVEFLGTKEATNTETHAPYVDAREAAFNNGEAPADDLPF